MMHRYSLILVAAFALLASLFSGCVEENVSDDTSLQLSFSCDTVVFDTLFSGQSSATKRFMIYNRNKRALSISEVYLAGGASSSFRFNVDGRMAGRGERLRDIIIKGRDSLFVFIETTPPEPDKVSEVVTIDSLIFLCNNRPKNVKLMSVGRSVRLLNNVKVEGDVTFDSVRPYLVFGLIYVPENSKLTLNEGVELFMHGGSHIVVDGSLECHGSFEHPVVIRGDRFDYINDVDHTPYDHTAGQWGTIDLRNSKSEYIFENTKIRGAGGGIILRGALRSSPKLVFRNSVIHNSSAYGIYSQMGDVVIENSELSNCGESCLVLLGGSLKVAHTTFANYYRFATREHPSVRILNYTKLNNQLYTFPVSSAVIENSIIFGGNKEELELARDTSNGTDFNVLLSYSLIKGKRVDNQYFNNCFWAKSRNVNNASDTVFVNVSVENVSKSGYFDFHLDSLSHARNCASSSLSSQYPLDLDGKSRMTDGSPDLGAYER